MVQLVFDYPAKYAVGACNLTPLKHTIDGTEFLEYPLKNVYFDSKKHRVTFSHAEGYGSSSFFMHVMDDLYIRVGNADNYEHFLSKLGTENRATIAQWVAKYRVEFSDFEAANAVKAANVAARNAQIAVERAESDRKYAEREAARKETQEKAIQESLAKFLNKEKIVYEHFEELCKRNDVVMHPRTIGSCRNNVSTIGIDQLTGTRKAPQSIFAHARELYAKLSEPTE